MSKIKVLWVENAPDELDMFKNLIESDEKIELVHFYDSESACLYLDEHVEDLSAAILDIESWIDKDSPEEKFASFFRITNKTNELSNRNKVEYFAFSGKATYLEDSDFSKNYNCTLFDKNYETRRAYNYLKEIIANHKSAQIKYKYSKAFTIFDCKIGELPVIDSSLENKIIDLVKAWEDYSLLSSSHFHGLIRPITEKIVNVMIEMDVISNHLKTWNERSRYIGDLSSKFSEDIPSYIARSIHTIFDVCPEGIHNTNLFDMINKGEAPFLLQSLSLELFNLMAWFPVFLKGHSNFQDNKKKFIYKIGIKDTIRMGDTGPIICGHRLPTNFEEYKDKKATIIEVNANTGKDKLKYPYFAKKISIEK